MQDRVDRQSEIDKGAIICHLRLHSSSFRCCSLKGRRVNDGIVRTHNVKGMILLGGGESERERVSSIFSILANECD